jgi:hypothetical protein
MTYWGNYKYNIYKLKLSLRPNRLIFTPIEQTYTQELERITTRVRMGKDETQWASKVRLVGLLELQWRTPHYD